MTYRKQGACEIQRMTKGTIPDVPFARIKNTILGKDYSLSLIFPTLALSIALHKEHKKKNDPVNILSFPLDDQSGEIFITLSKARTEAKNFNMNYINYLTYLFIHGCVHLLGHDHGDEMDIIEKKHCATFKVSHPLDIS